MHATIPSIICAHMLCPRLLQIAASRQNAALAREVQLQNKRSAAFKERENDILVEQEKARILANNKELVAYTYRSKFATQREAKEWGTSSLLQFRADYFGAAVDNPDDLSGFESDDGHRAGHITKPPPSTLY